MLNYLIGLKDATLKKFGPILGTIILVLGVIVAVSIIGAVVKALFGLAVALVIGAAILFGVYKLFEAISSKKS